MVPGVDTIQRMKDSMGIGKPFPGPGGISIPWSKATPRMKLGRVLSSPGFASLAGMVGFGAAVQGLQRGGVLGGATTVAGGAMLGYSLASMAGLATVTPAMGAIGGAGAALMAVGLKRGGVAGVAMSTIGGIFAGATIGAMFGPAGVLAGAVIGGAVGLGAGIVRLFVKSADQKLCEKIKQVYGIDIPDQKIRQQILELAKSQYGGNLDVAVRSPQVSVLVWSE